MAEWLFIFAHPDDESVSCAATIKQLTTVGEHVQVVSVTAGQAGEVHPRSTATVQTEGSLAQVRKQELAKACQLMGVQQFSVLDFEDGQITNQDTWGKLQLTALELIESSKPDYVITFDHTGWYFHLDHVAVSIAVTRAYQHSTHRPTALLHAVIPMTESTKWVYDFPAVLPTHRVPVSDVQFKQQVLDCHATQDLTTPQQWLSDPNRRWEWFRLVTGSLNSKIFETTAV